MTHAETVEKLRSALHRADGFRGAFTPNANDGGVRAKIGGHMQTLMGHFLPTNTAGQAKAERIELLLPDGDRLIGFLWRPAREQELGWLHVFHGLSGSSESAYMPRAAQSALELGFAAVLWNHRGCGAGRGLALETYHSGRSDDLGRAVRWGRERFKGVHGVLGYSLSANAACLLAAQVVPAIDSEPLSTSVFEKSLGASLPDFVIAVNPPFDLKRASDRLTYGPARIYGQSFMTSLLEGLDDRAKWQPENEKRRAFRNLAQRARKKLSRFSNVETFDAAYTGPAGGFRDHLDYYERASCGPYLERAKIPLVILSADDDPITHGFSDLPSGLLGNFKNPLVIIDAQTHGGHMGYVDRAALKSLWSPRRPPHTRWLERRLELYLTDLAGLGALT